MDRPPPLVRTVDAVGFTADVALPVLLLLDGTEVVLVGIEMLNGAQTEAKRLSKTKR